MKIYPWHESAWTKLAPRLDLLPHALLFHGLRGTGKLSFVRNITQLLVCENISQDNFPCGQCSPCNWLENDAHPDVVMISPEAINSQSGSANKEKSIDGRQNSGSQQIVISQIRALHEFINVGPQRARYKIIIIIPAETMNLQTSNALLKMLEEPPENTLFFLVSHQVRSISPTILSRCQRINLTMPTQHQATSWLAQQNIQNAELALAQTGNAPLIAKDLDKDEYWPQRKIFLDQLCARNVNPITIAENFQRQNLSRTLRWLQCWLIDLMILKFTGHTRYHLDYELIQRNLVIKLNPKELSRFYREVVNGQRFVNHPLNPRLVLEALLIGYMSLVSSVEVK